jgi:hypothetical protein
VRWIRRNRRAAEAWLGPFWLGLLDGLSGVFSLFVAGLMLALLLPSGRPPQALFENLSQIGATIFVAYSVSTTGVAYRRQELEQHVNWLGSICGVGALGVTGLGLSLLLAAERGAGHSGAWFTAGLCWILATIVLMCALIAFLPYATFSWGRQAEKDPTRE